MSKKYSGTRLPYTERIGTPKVTKDPAGNAILLCPFCNPPHALDTNGASPCGTILQVRAVQIVYKSKFNKKLVCVKCQQGGGDLVHFNNAYIHTHDCTPGVATFVEPPKFSKAAALVFRLPKWIQKRVEKYLGESKAVEEVTEDGTRTGKTLGYFFWRKA